MRKAGSALSVGFHEAPGSAEVMDRGDRDGSGLDFVVRSDKLLDRAESATTEFVRDRIRPRCIRIDHAHQPYWRALLSKLVVDAGMVPSEDAHADDGDISEVLSGQLSVLSWLVAGGLLI